MSDDRNALGVEAVIERFATAEQLLADAALRVHSLSDASSSATQSATALANAAGGITAAAEQLVAMTAEMQGAHRSLVDAMGLARQFLEATDVSAVAETLKRLEKRLEAIEKGQAASETLKRLEAIERSQTALSEQLVQDSDDHAVQLNALASVVDRSAALEKARDEATQRLQIVMQQLPGRVAKKFQ